jgi:hypothetical protein
MAENHRIPQMGRTFREEHGQLALAEWYSKKPTEAKKI